MPVTRELHLFEPSKGKQLLVLHQGRLRAEKVTVGGQSNEGKNAINCALDGFFPICYLIQGDLMSF